MEDLSNPEKTRYSGTFVEASAIEAVHQELKVRQVYVWLMTQDGKIVIVSKDGEHWQLPGGKPDHTEAIEKGALREIYEETSLQLSDCGEMFGYHVRSGFNRQGNREQYLQLRYAKVIEEYSPDLSLTPREPIDDHTAVRFVIAVDLSSIGDYMPWLDESGEMEGFLTKLKV